MTSASATLIGWPMKANTIRTSATPMIQPAICTTVLAMRSDRDCVDRGQVLIDGIDRAEHAPLPVTRETRDDGTKDALPAAALRQIEGCEQEARKAEADRGRPRQRRVRSERDQHEEPDNRKCELGCRLEQNVDDDAGGRERAGNPVEPQQPRADDVAADLRHGQQDVGRLPNESQEHAYAKSWPRLRRKNQPPAHPGHGNRDAAHHHDEEDSPSDAGNRMADRVQAGPRRDSDDGGDPDQPGSHTGLLDHLRSVPPHLPVRPPVGASSRQIGARYEPARLVVRVCGAPVPP